MQKYWFRMRYSPEAFQGMVSEPRSRAPEIEKMFGGSAWNCSMLASVCHRVRYVRLLKERASKLGKSNLRVWPAALSSKLIS